MSESLSIPRVSLFIREAWKNVRSAPVLSLVAVLTIAVSLILVGLFILIGIYIFVSWSMDKMNAEAVEFETQQGKTTQSCP